MEMPMFFLKDNVLRETVNSLGHQGEKEMRSEKKKRAHLTAVREWLQNGVRPEWHYMGIHVPFRWFNQSKVGKKINVPNFTAQSMCYTEMYRGIFQLHVFLKYSNK